MRSFIKKIFGSGRLKIAKSPHEIFPEIMHWEEWDELVIGLQTYSYRSIGNDGNLYISRFGGVVEKINIKQAHNICNISLRNRRLHKEIDETEEYMQLIRDFQSAYKEISK